MAVWEKEKEDYILSHKEMKEDMRNFYKCFSANFPDFVVTYGAFCSKCSRLKINPVNYIPWSTKAKPLYAENHSKDGYVRIKVAQPGEWMLKSKWVYIETHPAEALEHYNSKKYSYVFLNQDKHDFRPENIVAVKKELMGIICATGGFTDNPEENKIKILQAELKRKINLIGVKIGTHTQYNNGIKSKADRCRIARIATNKLSPEERKKRHHEAWIRTKQRLETDAEFRAKYKAQRKEESKRYTEKCRKSAVK